LQAGGHHLCRGLSEEHETTTIPRRSSRQGFFPKGGSYGTLYPAYNTPIDRL
jgi:hypothetical protein